MANRPKFREYAVIVFKRSLARFEGLDLGITIISYAAIVLLASDLLTKDQFEERVSFIAIGWLLILFFVITPYRVWADEKHAVLQTEEASKPKIQTAWRFNGSYAELILTNRSIKTLTGIEVIFRNYRKADGSGLRDLHRSLISNDGKKTPIDLNPGVETYFRFAELGIVHIGGTASIVITFGDGEEKWLGQEAVIKLGISGGDIGNLNIKRLLIVKNNKEIAIQPWEKDE